MAAAALGTQAILLNKNGQFIKTVGAGVLGGTDEIWYDPTTGKFYVTGNNNTNTGRFFDVVDQNGNILQTVDLPTTSSAHSIAVDPFNGDVFVALAGSNAAGANTACPLGCIAVFARSARPHSRGRTARLDFGRRWSTRLVAQEADGFRCSRIRLTKTPNSDFGETAARRSFSLHPEIKSTAVRPRLLPLYQI